MKTEVEIKTQKLRISDLENHNHIGFVTENGKGYVCHVGDFKYAPIYVNEGTLCCNLGAGKNAGTQFDSLKDCLLDFDNMTYCYRFYTRKELYQWLAE